MLIYHFEFSLEWKSRASLSFYHHLCLNLLSLVIQKTYVGVAISELEFDKWLANLPDLSAVEAVNSDSGVTPTGTEALLHSTDSNFAVTSTSELKRLQEKNYNKNTMKSTVTWLNRFDR